MTLAQESADDAERDRARTDDPSPRSEDHSDAIAETGRQDADAMQPLTIDRAALQVLKEEAERELSLRRAQASEVRREFLPTKFSQHPAMRLRTGVRKPRGGQPPKKRRSGWVRAVLPLLLMMAALVGLLVAIYLRAPAISHTYPNTEGPLQSYLEAANAFLGWLNGVLGRQPGN